LPQWRVNRRFVETTCRITAPPRVEIRESPEGRSFRPAVPFSYQVDDTTYHSDQFDVTPIWPVEGADAQQLAAGPVLAPTWLAEREAAEEIANRYQAGQTYPCWYDRNEPQMAVLVRWHRFSYWTVLLLPSALLAIGLGGLAYTFWQSYASRERRAALAKRASDIELFNDQRVSAGEYPTVPPDSDFKNSPGTTLAYRLPTASSTGWKLFGAIVSCLLWNGLTLFFLLLAVSRHLSGKHDWLLSLMVIGFAAGGVWLVVHFLQQFVAASRVGSTRLEISAHPLVPGESYDVFISQSGRAGIEKLDLSLVCEEQATYCQGTDAITDNKTVDVIPVLETNDIPPLSGKPFETRCVLSVPASAMHSFRSRHNKVDWKLVVRSKPPRWEARQRCFPVLVVHRGAATDPASSGEASDAVPADGET
jgi:hypothetical protein